MRMRSWFLAVVNCFGAFVALGICVLDLSAEGGGWATFIIVVLIAFAEGALILYCAQHIFQSSRGTTRSKKP